MDTFSNLRICNKLDFSNLRIYNKLEREDSNLYYTAPKADALPLGDAPNILRLKKKANKIKGRDGI